MRAIALFALCLVWNFTAAAQATHCGTERWGIKTGTDRGASGIDLQNPQSTTLQTLVQIQAPAPIPPDDRVSGPETTLWQINATLTAFKFENGRTGDSDYHLVLTDEDSGETMIAEIPSPDCVDQSSPFLAGITKARQAFDSQFTAQSSFQVVSVPVTVTGVGMFDFAHGQRGYALNGIELHPVLDIAFGGDAGGVPTGAVTTSAAEPRALHASLQQQRPVQLLKDPSFEAETRRGAWQATPGVINDIQSEPAHSGRWKAWLGGQGTRGVDTLSQTVTIPGSAKTAKLIFWLRIDTDEITKTVAYDTLTIAVKSASGEVTPLEEGEYSNLDAAPYGRRTFDLSAYIGKQITILFTAKEDNGKQTSFLIDDCRLVIQ
jgi:hypothetical protein